MKNPELYYAAGLLEGEGWFNTTISNGYFRFVIGAQMCDKEPLQKLQTLLGGKIYGPYKRGTNKPHYTWELGRRGNSIRVMKQLYPLMSPRRQKQITIVLEKAIRQPSQSKKFL